MLKYIMAGALLATSCGAASAAVYRYDIALELQSNTVFDVYGSFGSFPAEVPNGITCDGDEVFVSCAGTATQDVFDGSSGREELRLYPRFVDATLILDTEFDPRTGMGQRPECTGSSTVCGFNDVYEYSASATGFGILSGSFSFEESFTSSGYRYEDDSASEFIFGGREYSFIGGTRVIYETTSLTISKVPLPASLPFILSGFGMLALMRRRSKSAD